MSDDDGPPPLEEAPLEEAPLEEVSPKFMRRWVPGGQAWIEGPGFEAAKEEMRNAVTEEEKVQAGNKLMRFFVMIRPRCEIAPYSEGEEGILMTMEDVRHYIGETQNDEKKEDE